MRHMARVRRSPVPAFVIAMLAVGCATATADREAEVRDAVRRLQRCERERDAEGVLALIAPGFYMYQDGQRVGYERIAEQIRTTLPALRSFEPRFDDVEVTLLGPDTALVSMRFHDVIVGPDGSISRMQGPTTLIWKRLGGTWRMIYGDADHYPADDARPDGRPARSGG